MFLVVNAGGAVVAPPAALTKEAEDTEESHIHVEERGSLLNTNRKFKKPSKGSRAYIEAKKERMRRRGL